MVSSLYGYEPPLRLETLHQLREGGGGWRKTHQHTQHMYWYFCSVSAYVVYIFLPPPPALLSLHYDLIRDIEI
jgi:hypothetical protein